MEDVVFFSTGCPKCKVLKKKLDDKGISYTENHSVDEMISLGMMSAPSLRVGEELMNFTAAVQWVNNQ